MIFTIPDDAPLFEYRCYSIRDLKSFASKRKIPRYGQMTKQQLIDSLESD
jgi:hypothetical protein